MCLVVKCLGCQAYIETWQAMRQFTESRTEHTPDEIWLVQHSPVYTQGLNGKTEHLLNPNGIEVVQTDRGGQITYHGPGQLVLYPLLDLPRHNLKVRQLISALEQSVIDLLEAFSIRAYARKDAPGVYIEGRKIASLGIKVRRQCTYHGIALNVDMDLSPFYGINPCGHAGLQMTQLREWVNPLPCWETIEQKWVETLIKTANLPAPAQVI